MTDELPGGIDAKKLARRVLREFGSYGVSEWGEEALPDMIFKVSGKYQDLSYEERAVVDRAVSEELYG